MIQTVLGILLLVGLGVGIWNSIPPEDPETIEARKRYGRVGD